MDNFCSGCGLAVGAPQSVQPPTVEVVPGAGALGLGRNSVVHVVKEGLQGLQIRSDITLFLAFVIPIPVLGIVYFLLGAGALALYLTLWIVMSGLIYDSLRWRGLKSLEMSSPADPQQGRDSWFVPWSSINLADWNGRTLWFSSAGQKRKLAVTFDPEDAPLVQQSLDNSRVRYSWRGPRLPQFITHFTTLVIIFFVISQIILISAATLPFFPGEEGVYKMVLNNTQSQVVGASFFGEFRAIFLNNIQVALGGAIPFLGAIGFSIASYSTGRVVQVIAIDDGISSARILLALYILPHTWVEESAYPIAAVAGMLGVTKWRSVTPRDFRKRLNWGSTKLALALTAAGLILFAAGFIETLTSYIGVLAITLWIPVGVAAFLLRRQYQRTEPIAVA